MIDRKLYDPSVSWLGEQHKNSVLMDGKGPNLHLPKCMQPNMYPLGCKGIKRLPQGLSCSPGVFQKVTDRIVRKLENSTAYLDDLLCASRDEAGHIRDVDLLLENIKASGLKLKKSKCDFFRTSVIYLGYFFSWEGLLPSPSNVKCIVMLPIPTTKRGVRAVLGSTGYFRFHIQNYSQLTRPLLKLTHNDVPFRWTPACTQAFDTLKECLVRAPVLKLPEVGKAFRLYTDASAETIGCCVTQEGNDGKERVCLYLSRQLTPTQRRWPTLKREAYAIYHFMKRLRSWILGSQIDVFTDHAPLKTYFTKHVKNPLVMQWGIELSEYQARIHYIKGSLNCTADLCSRIPPTSNPRQNSHRSNQTTNPDDGDHVELYAIKIADTRDIKHGYHVGVRRKNGKRIRPLPWPEYTDSDGWEINNIDGEESEAEGESYGPDELGLSDQEMLDHINKSIEKAENALELPGEGETSRDASQVTDPTVRDNQEDEDKDIPEGENVLEDPIHKLPPEEKEKVQLEDWCPALIQEMQRKDPILGPIVKRLGEGLYSHEYIMEFGKLYHIPRPYRREVPHLQLAIPREAISAVLKVYHDYQGHCAAQRMYDLLRQRYFWHGMLADCMRKVSQCTACKVVTSKSPLVPLQAPAIGNKPGVRISIDFYGYLPESLEGYKYLFTVMDEFSLYLEAYPTRSKSAREAVTHLMESYFPQHGVPLEILSDQDQAFNSELMQSLMEGLHISHLRTTPFSPQTNGRLERSHRFITEVFRKCCFNDDRTWVQYVAPMLIAYRAAPCESTGNSPFYIHKGYDMSLPGDLIFGARQKYLGEDYSKQAIQRVYQTFQLAKKHLIDSQWYNLQRVNKDRETPEFQIGEPVLYRYPGTLAGGNKEGLQSKKLRGTFLPYWRILERKSPVNYVIYNEINGKTRRVHSRNLVRATLENTWFNRNSEYVPLPARKKKVKWIKPAPLEQELQYEKETRLQEELSKMVGRPKPQRGRDYLPRGAKMVENEPHFGQDFEWPQPQKSAQRLPSRNHSTEEGKVFYDNPSTTPKHSHSSDHKGEQHFVETTTPQESNQQNRKEGRKDTRNQQDETGGQQERKPDDMEIDD